MRVLEILRISICVVLDLLWLALSCGWSHLNCSRSLCCIEIEQSSHGRSFCVSRLADRQLLGRRASWQRALMLGIVVRPETSLVWLRTRASPAKVQLYPGRYPEIAMQSCYLRKKEQRVREQKAGDLMISIYFLSSWAHYSKHTATGN